MGGTWERTRSPIRGQCLGVFGRYPWRRERRDLCVFPISLSSDAVALLSPLTVDNRLDSMSTTNLDRRPVMDLSPALLLAHPTKASIPLSEKSTASSALSQHSRRSSIPHIFDLGSSALGLAKRSPLAPLDIQRRSSLNNYEPSSSTVFAAMAIGEDEKPTKQSSVYPSFFFSCRFPQLTFSP